MHIRLTAPVPFDADSIDTYHDGTPIARPVGLEYPSFYGDKRDLYDALTVLHSLVIRSEYDHQIENPYDQESIDEIRRRVRYQSDLARKINTWKGVQA